MEKKNKNKIGYIFWGGVLVFIWEYLVLQVF